MAEHDTANDSADRYPRIDSALWVAVLLPPTAWALNVGVGLQVVRVVCISQSRGVLVLSHLVSIALALAAVAIARRGGRRTAAERGVAVRERSLFIVDLASGLAAMFTLVMLASLVYMLTLRACPP
jgi:hypothetical protein